jgi:hypothetical protein
MADRRPHGVNDPMPDALPAPTAAKDDTFTFVTSAVSAPDGVVCYFHFPGDAGNDRVVVETVDGPERLELPMPNADGGASGSLMRGWLPQDDRRIDRTLHEAKGARAMRDDVDGRPCVRVDAETDRGRYCVWFDPSRGGNIVKARIERGPRHVTRDGILWQSMRRRTRTPPQAPFDANDEKVLETTDIRGVELRRFGDVWLPVAMTCVGDGVDRDGDHFKVQYQLRADITLSPRFADDAFTIRAPDGTKVMLRAGNDVVEPGLEWRAGRAVPPKTPQP